MLLYVEKASQRSKLLCVTSARANGQCECEFMGNIGLDQREVSTLQHTHNTSKSQWKLLIGSCERRRIQVDNNNEKKKEKERKRPFNVISIIYDAHS